MLAFTLHPPPASGAPRLVLIHSLALDRSVWDGVVDRLSGEYEILTYDCRGHGQSPKPAGPYTVELFAGDLAELLVSTEAEQRVDVIDVGRFWQRRWTARSTSELL